MARSSNPCVDDPGEDWGHRGLLLRELSSSASAFENAGIVPASSSDNHEKAWLLPRRMRRLRFGCYHEALGGAALNVFVGHTANRIEIMAVISDKSLGYLVVCHPYSGRDYAGFLKGLARFS